MVATVSHVLIGLEQDAYEDYLMQSGVPYSEQGAALIVNSVVKNPDSRGYEAKKDMVPYLKTQRRSVFRSNREVPGLHSGGLPF